MDLVSIIVAAFQAGVKAEAQKQATKAGRVLVQEVAEAAPVAIEQSNQDLMAALSAIESGASMVTTPKKRSRSARRADKRLSEAFKEANRRYRKKDGSLRAGRTQSDIAKLAQKLRRQSTKKGQVRKTARRAYEGRRR